LSKLTDKQYFSHKSIRDPLYGFVNLSKKETEIIDTFVFRRLQNIKQLSHAFVVYPSAVHTRFEHSLGALHVADRMCQQLELDRKERELVRLSILLHDIGHGPFSHLFENVLKKINTEEFDHEDIFTWIVNENPEISSIVKSYKKSIIEILQKMTEFPNGNLLENPSYQILSQVVLTRTN